LLCARSSHGQREEEGERESAVSSEKIYKDDGNARLLKAAATGSHCEVTRREKDSGGDAALVHDDDDDDDDGDDVVQVVVATLPYPKGSTIYTAYQRFVYSWQGPWVTFVAC